MTDLKAQLQAHLGDAFTLERELGGGGMSRVFVALENRLSRKVAIKVLSPELAQGLNAERFEREILLAASLQQANIVPMLSAGELDGLPYFTMPFVEGESLRSRITPQGMPIAEVVAILRDVTRALAYAHARGIVHRDIKPDNVLLSGGAAVVTDFGIAKALSASRTGGENATLTSVGTSIGTPSYMAPEQVAGDPNVDHRVDLYALGCMAMELLTGASPFANHTPQRMLAAHLSEAPPSVESRRGDCPPALARLVAKLLEKDPADRTQTAQDVLRSIEELSTTSTPNMSLNAPGMLPKALAVYAVATGTVAIVAKAAVVGIGLPEWTLPGAMIVMLLGLPSLLLTAYVKRVQRSAATATPTLTPGGTPAMRPPSGTMATMALKASRHVSWKRTMRGGIYAMSGFVLILVAFMVTRSMGIGPAASLFAAGSLQAQDKILIADFSAASEDSAFAQIVQSAVREAMGQSRAVKLLSENEVLGVLAQMQQPDAALDAAVAREVAERSGAQAILGGQLTKAGSGFAISLELTSTSGTKLASFQGAADSPSELLATVDGLTKKLRGKLGESLKQVQASIPLEQATTANLEALRLYTEGVRANDVTQDYEHAIRVLRDAVAKDSTFALAWRKLAVAMWNARLFGPGIDSTLEKAALYADKLPPREKYLVMGALYGMHSSRPDRGKQLEAYRAMYALDSSSTTAINQLSIGFADRNQMDSALRYARRNVTVDPRSANRLLLAGTLSGSGEPAAALRLLDSIRQADPDFAATGQLMHAEAKAREALGELSAADSLAREMARSTSPRNRVAGLNVGSNLAMRAGRLQEAVARERERIAYQGTRGLPQVGSADIQADLFVRGRVAEAVRKLDRLVASPEWAAVPESQRPYLNISRLYAQAGEATKARRMMTAALAADPEYFRSLDGKWNVDWMEGFHLLAEGKPTEALAAWRAGSVHPDGDPIACEACIPAVMAIAFDSLRQADSAQAWLERYLAITPVSRSGLDGVLLAKTHKRLGELYDAKGERLKAIEHYQAFVDGWKDADADLQPVVASVKKRLAELQGQEGR